ncbi:MAG: hypothetical protein ACRENA_10085, partial [Vulcanimicrobiaceae bacterium]
MPISPVAIVAVRVQGRFRVESLLQVVRFTNVGPFDSTCRLPTGPGMPRTPLGLPALREAGAAGR